MSRSFILDDETCDVIRGRYAQGGVNQQELADEYCVGQMTISRIINNTDRRAPNWLNHQKRVKQALSTVIDGMRPIPNHPGFFVDENARFLSMWEDTKREWHKRELVIPRTIIPVFKDSNVYLVIQLYRMQVRVADAVLWTFVGPRPDGMEALHLDDDSYNNAAYNLKWGTHVENCAMRVQ